MPESRRDAGDLRLRRRVLRGARHSGTRVHLGRRRLARQAPEVPLQRRRDEQYVWTLLRKTGEILDRFGRNGRNAGQFHWVHNLAVDSKGNIYTAEVDTGKRVQKFTLKDDDRGATRTTDGRGRDKDRPRPAIGRADRHSKPCLERGRRRMAPAVVCIAPGRRPGHPALDAGQAHDIPDEILLHGFVKPEGDRLHFLVRVPLAMLLSMNLPKRGPGYLDLTRSTTSSGRRRRPRQRGSSCTRTGSR